MMSFGIWQIMSMGIGLLALALLIGFPIVCFRKIFQRAGISKSFALLWILPALFGIFLTLAANFLGEYNSLLLAMIPGVVVIVWGVVFFMFIGLLAFKKWPNDDKMIEGA